MDFSETRLTGQRLRHAQRERGEIETGADEEGQIARRRLGEPGFRRRRGPRGRRDVVQQGGDFIAMRDINCRMMNLQQHGETAHRQIAKTVQPFDHIHFPQRALQIKRAGVDARGLNAELAPVARFGQREVAHVIFDIESLVLDPVRVVEIQRHAQNLLAKDRQAAEAALDMRQDLLETDLAPRRGGLIVDMQQRDVRVGVGAIRIDVGSIVFAQLSHASPSWRDSNNRRSRFIVAQACCRAPQALEQAPRLKWLPVALGLRQPVGNDGEHDAIEAQSEMAARHLNVLVQGRVAVDGGFLRRHHAIAERIQATGWNRQPARSRSFFARGCMTCAASASWCDASRYMALTARATGYRRIDTDRAAQRDDRAHAFDVLRRPRARTRRPGSIRPG